MYVNAIYLVADILKWYNMNEFCSEFFRQNFLGYNV